MSEFIQERLADGGVVDWFMLAAALLWLFAAPLLPARRDVPPRGVVPASAVRRSPFGRLAERNARIIKEREARNG